MASAQCGSVAANARSYWRFQYAKLGGERWPRKNWRRGRDSNPRYGCPYAAFRVRCFQPLSHLSVAIRGWQDVSPPVARYVTNGMP